MRKRDVEKHALGFLQVKPLPTLEELSEYYREVYYQKCPSSTYAPAYSSDEARYIDNHAVIAEYCFQQLTAKPTGTLLDVGCGEGFFPAYFARRGWEVRACDFSSHGIETKNPDLLPSFVAGDIFATIQKFIGDKKVFDFINLANIVEHVLDPVGLLVSMKRLMHPGSLLRVMVPNDYSEFQGFLRGNGFIDREYWLSPPDHLSYFGFESLANLLAESGFKVRDSLTDFPIEMYLANAHSNYCKDNTTGKAAHQARVLIGNFLVEQGLDKYVAFARAAAGIHFGRSVIMLGSLADE